MTPWSPSTMAQEASVAGFSLGRCCVAEFSARRLSGQVACRWGSRRSWRTVDLVICYECLQIQTYDAEKQTAGLLTANEVEAEVHAAFLSAGVRSAP